MNQLPSISKEIADIYFIANTPSSFYRMMRENYFMQTSLAPVPSNILIDEFNKRASSVDSPTDIANVYALFIALTFKEPNEVKDFFQKAKDIKFEWFSQIAQYYLQNPTPNISYTTFQVKHEIELPTSRAQYADIPVIQKMNFTN